MTFIKKSKKLLICAFCLFLLTFLNDECYLNFANINVGNYILCKIILFVILFFVCKLILKISKNKDKEKIIKYFLVYLIPMLIIFLLIYPGVWYSDDFNFLRVSKTVDFLYDLNYLSSIYYSVCLMLIPYPIGVEIIQIILASSVVSYIVYELDTIFKSKFVYLAFIPFFLPLTIFYTIYANRPCFYGIFYLLYFVILFFTFIKKE